MTDFSFFSGEHGAAIYGKMERLAGQLTEVNSLAHELADLGITVRFTALPERNGLLKTASHVRAECFPSTPPSTPPLTPSSTELEQ